MRIVLRATLIVFALIVAALALLAAEPAAGESARPFPQIAILVYHDLSTDPRSRSDAVSPEAFREQVRALKAAGWTFLSLGEVLAARERPQDLPERVAVITFDDGYHSFHQHALPVLAAERIKATLSVVTGFVDQPPADLPRLMTWSEIRDAQASGWVEIASHSHDLHRYVTHNSWHDSAPAVTSRRYLEDERRYEDRDEYWVRIQSDLERSQRLLEEHLGAPARVLAWPYGEHNQAAGQMAAQAGFEVTLALGSRPVSAADLKSGVLPRVMVTRDLKIGNGAVFGAWLEPRTGAIRAAQVDLDAVWDPDTARFRLNVDRIVERIHHTGATHVFLQACPDPRGDARFEQAWFMNHQAPVKADILSMLAAKLAHTRVETWIRVPSMNLPWAWERHADWRMPFRLEDADQGRRPWYYRLAPDHPEARKAAVDFMADAAVYLPIRGILFDDDAYALAGEGLSSAPGATAEEKAEAILELHREIMDAVRVWRPDCKFARNLYAPVVERPGAHPGFAQDYERSLATYDLTVVMAYSRMEGQRKNGKRWMAALGRSAVRRWNERAPGAAGPPPVLFKLQTYDWSTRRWVPARELRHLAAEARRTGIVHLGVYPVLPEDGNIPDRLLETSATLDHAAGAQRK